MKTSRWKRHDKNAGLWIASNKRIYFYWFRFLQHAQNDPSRVVDWSAYQGWGSAEEIKSTKFDPWWRKNWKTLFGYKQGETEPLYSLSQTKPQAEGIRYALMVYELRNTPLINGNIDDDGVKGNKWEIAKRIAVVEYPKRRAKGWEDENFHPEKWNFNLARKSIARELRKEDPTEFRKQKKILQSRVGRYMRAAATHLDNVCVGKFP